MQTTELKTMVLGPRSGKSTFIKSICNINYNYINSTLGCDVTPYDIHTNNGKKRLNFWEVGSEYQGLKDQYCLGADLAIIFKKNNNEHLEFENWLYNDIPKIYVENYNINHNENIIQNIKNIITENLL
jgi:hypothetical protein